MKKEIPTRKPQFSVYFDKEFNSLESLQNRPECIAFVLNALLSCFANTLNDHTNLTWRPKRLINDTNTGQVLNEYFTVNNNNNNNNNNNEFISSTSIVYNGSSS